MEGPDLPARVRALIDGGAGEPIPGGAAGDRFLPLVTLDSGARCGLDAAGRWILVPDDGRAPVRWAPELAHLFHEPLEWKRDRFDDAIEQAARALGLPPDDVVFAFPAIEVIRAVLAKQQSYLTRLALQWIRPTELRPLRADIVAVTKQDDIPAAIKLLAERLVVPA
jgi:hypothetical protein